MAIVKHAVNGGQAEVSDEQAKVLIESGGWVADEPVEKSVAKVAAKRHAEASSKLEK